jgi:hypothetical protein
MRILRTAVLMFAIGVGFFGCAARTTEEQFEEFVTAHVKKIKPMAKEVHLAYWQAANSGRPEDYDRVSNLELKIRQIYANSREFALLKRIKDSGEVKDAVLARQLEALYNGYLENQIDPELLKRIVELGTEIEKNFSIEDGDGFDKEAGGVAGQQTSRAGGCGGSY